MGDLPCLYEEPINWNKVLLFYESALAEVLTRINVIRKEHKLLHNTSPIEHVSSRIKSVDSILRKLRINNYEPTLENVVKHINDVAGIRIVCSFTSDIFDIAAYIMHQQDFKVLKVKDYINNPKENGYMSYHMIISVPVHLSEQTMFTKVEIQIRTSAMDFWASLEHKIYYKFDKKVPDHIVRELKECADITAFLDRKMLALNEEVINYKDQDEVDLEIVEQVETLAEYIGIVVD